MNTTTLRFLSPALVTACLALPLNAEHEKTNSTTSTAGKIPQWELSEPGSRASSAHQTLGHVARVSDVIGLEVKNLQDESLGKVNDLAVDVGSGRIVEVILATGGVFGLGTTMVGVPPTAFHYDETAKILHLDITKEALKGKPGFDATRWETHFQPTNVVQVYRAYGVDPYFSDAGTDADNTGRNRRDYTNGTARDGGSAEDAARLGEPTALTPVDQGNSPSDLAVTQTIRKAVLAREGLSVNAQNVKIITKDGRVTLRGPVNTEAEKQAIATIATDSVPVGQVVNQIEVTGGTVNN